MKPKSIITRLRIVRFQWFLDQNDRNFMGILLQRSKGQNSFIFDEFWWFFWFFDIKIWPFFSKVKNPKNFPRPNSVSPTSRGGIIYCVGPCFLIQKNRQKDVEKKTKKKSRPTKKAGPEAPENSYKKQIQNSKQQRGRLRRPPHFWGCCYEVWIGFLKEFSGASGPAFFLAWVFSWLFPRLLFDEFFVIKNVGRRNKKKHS